MKYISTRGSAPDLAFDDVLLAGLARDGGLYVPDVWPTIDADTLRGFADQSYQQVAARVMGPFVEGVISESDLADIIDRAYQGFGDDPAPMKEIGDNEWLMELFHGPTLAFKDYALQVLGLLFDHVLSKRGEKVTIVGATSGDTGSAAIEACRDRDSIEIFILHPKGRVSDVQRRQMTTVQSANVHNIAIEGSFDDCQDMVKAMFNDIEFRDGHNLSAVNSINWARIMAQIVYYFYAASRVGAPGNDVCFAVPTGNFGNVFAGYSAKRMGLPINQLIVGSNANDILTRFFETREMTMRPVTPTLSPSMDIQVSSNLERLLFDVFGRDGGVTAAAMNAFRESGSLGLGQNQWETIRTLFDGARFDDEATKATIREVYEATGELLDPHSAVGVAAGRAMRRDASVPMIDLATAHPAKFPDAVKAATGTHAELPDALSDLFERDERFDVLPNDLGAVMDYVAAKGKGKSKDQTS